MKLALVAFALAATSLFACAATTDDGQDDADSDDVSNDEVIAAKIADIDVDLGDHPHQQASSCDVHTKLSIKSGKATLREVVTGIPGQAQCKLAVQPNERSYNLKLSKTDCGSRIYAGSMKKAGQKYAIEITDNRSRLCEDVIPGLLVVKETVPGFPGAITTTKYSRDAVVAPATLEVTGKLVHTMGIGGENTGYSVQTKTGMTELVLDAGEQNQFVEGKVARVRGTSKLLSGVETHDRSAIDVSDMLVCPDAGTLNCMPGPNVRLSNLCSGDNRSWVQANCAGVGYVD